MKLHFYYVFDNEYDNIPEDVTNAVIDTSVAVIKETAFRDCKQLLPVVTRNKVKSIWAFCLL